MPAPSLMSGGERWRCILAAAVAVAQPQPLRCEHHHTTPMADLLVFSTLERATQMAQVYLADNPGSTYTIQRLPDGRYRLVVEDPPVA